MGQYPVPTLVLHEIALEGQPLPDGVVGHEQVPQVLVATRLMYGGVEPVRPWACYLAVEAGLCVGTCGFTGPPVAGEAEIAYFTFPGHEGRGVATGMARALLDVARQRPDVQVIAHTLPAEGASTAILRKIGFRCAGEIDHAEDGKVWKWVLARTPR
jgi:RimJ/RimL family protein N-acetyltransferase